MKMLSAAIELAIEPLTAFDVVVEELVSALSRTGVEIEPTLNGRVREGSTEVGRIVSWIPGERMTIEWQPADWKPGEQSRIELRFEPVVNGTRVTLEHGGWGDLIGDASENAAWFARRVVAPLVRATSPAALGDWFTDRQARRPSGAGARAVYRHPLYHYPNFRVVLEELALSPDDYFLEVGCGGGALLKSALQSGCRAAAVDHSPDMIRVARAENKDAVDRGRLALIEASADALPLATDTFTCAAMTGVLGFLKQPVAALSEINRVLVSGGRVVIVGSDPELKGTPGAPEPIASRLRFYDDRGLETLGRNAGFSQVRVVRRDLEAFAREAGVPEEHLPLFAGPGSRFLLARKG